MTMAKSSNNMSMIGVYALLKQKRRELELQRSLSPRTDFEVQPMDTDRHLEVRSFSEINGNDDALNIDHEDASNNAFGRHQSPINIVTTSDGVSTVDLADGLYKVEPLSFSYPHSVRGCSILNNGHTVQINIGPENECTVTVKGKRYTLRQFHFHTPSEHTLDDRQYEMEMHLVHTDEEGNIAVLGFIFSVNTRYQTTTGALTQHRHGIDLDDEDEYDESAILKKMDPGNDFLDQFWSQLPSKKTTKDIPLENAISFDHLFEASSRSVQRSKKRGVVTVNMDIFQYDGSLSMSFHSFSLSLCV